MYDSCLGWKQLSQISKTLKTYCFHWNSWLLSQQHVPEVKSSTRHFGKKKEDEISSATEMQLIRALLVLPMRVIPALVLHGIAREHGFAIWSLSLACLISEQPPCCMGTHWSMQWLCFLLLPLKRSCIPKHDQHHFPSSAIFWNTCLCTALPCCSPLLPESDPGFWLWFMQWCCKQGGCAELD